MSNAILDELMQMDEDEERNRNHALHALPNGYDP